MVRIAVIQGDGIGKEVMPEAEATLLLAAEAVSFKIEFDHFEWGSDRYLKEGRALPEDSCEILAKDYDGIFHGAVGDPRVGGSIVQEQILLGLRFGLDLYANIRPSRLYHEDLTPIKNKKAGEIDHVVVRENTEGEYSSVGGRMFSGTDREFVTQQTVMTRTGVDRVLKFAFEL